MIFIIMVYSEYIPYFSVDKIGLGLFIKIWYDFNYGLTSKNRGVGESWEQAGAPYLPRLKLIALMGSSVAKKDPVAVGEVPIRDAGS